MTPLMKWWQQIVGRGRADSELAQEIQAHIAERVDDLVERGMSSDEARRTALQEFGNPVRCLEDSRAVWLIPWLVSVGQDVRYVLRTIRRQPVFSASVVLILTFGIGLVTALFTVFNATVLQPWPVPDPSSIVVIKPRPPATNRYGTLSSLEYRYFREHARSFSHLSCEHRRRRPHRPQRRHHVRDRAVAVRHRELLRRASYRHGAGPGVSSRGGGLPLAEGRRHHQRARLAPLLRERSGTGRRSDSSRRTDGDRRRRCRTRIR